MKDVSNQKTVILSTASEHDTFGCYCEVWLNAAHDRAFVCYVAE